MKIVLCLVLSIVAVTMGHYRDVCTVTKGKRMMQFSHDKLKVKFPCKYPAVRHSVCGNWDVVLTPGNDYATTGNGKRRGVYTRTLWLGLTNVKTNATWRGRSDLSIAKKWLAGNKDFPFNKKEGSLDTGSFNFSSRDDEHRVSILTPDGQVSVTFYIYYGRNAWQRESGFRFECNSEFNAADFPNQLCGSGTQGEAKDYRKAHKMNQHEAILYSVFTTKGIAQTNTYCKAAEKIMLRECKTEEKQKAAIESCWEFAVKGKVRSCVGRNNYEPMDVFNTCLEYICKGSPCDNDLSEELKIAIDGCKNVGDITTAIKKCHTDLEAEYCSRKPIPTCK